MSEYTHVERPFLDQLASLGWEMIDQGAGVPRDPARSLRSSFREVTLRDIFFESVRALNLLSDGRPWLTEDQLERLYMELIGQPAGNLLEANQRVQSLLYRSTVDRNEVTGEEDPDVTIIDFRNPERNRFIAINQFRIDTPGRVKPYIIPDIVLFVNGLPLVVVECKDPALNTANPFNEAFTQLLRYADRREETIAAGLHEGEPRLFHFNQFSVATHGEGARYGTITATEEFFHAWKDIYPESHKIYMPPLGREREQELLIQGMLPRETLLDITRNFILFAEAGGKKVKVAPLYQQYRAVCKTIDRVRAGKVAQERSGVVWHTQGSGKSFAMVFTVRKIRTSEDLKDYKVVMVNDRRDLEKQLGETAELTGEKVYYIDSSEKLRRGLAGGKSNLNMVMIHKFRENDERNVPAYLAGAIAGGLKLAAEPIPEYKTFGVINSSDRIIMMIDEAHRTQSSDMGHSLSDHMFEAFPNATFLAFTGTPLITDRHSKKTHERFGSYIDKYRLRDSVADGATVQILYEGKTADVALENRDIFDRKFEDLIGHRTDEEILAIKKKYGVTGDILEAERRIEAIAEDMVEHYVTRILPNGFKAQVVVSSKMAAIHYKTYIDRALEKTVEREQVKEKRDDEFIARIAFLKSAVIISSDGTNEKAVITQARRESQRVDAVGSFLKEFNPEKPETGIAFLIVCDMLLTGFNAPIEQVMYIDKKITEHNLLQTIARVNRVHKGKSCGYIVDYIGLANHLQEALAIYAGDDDDYADAHDSLKNIAAELPVLESRYQRLLNLFLEQGFMEIDDFINQRITDPSVNSIILEGVVDLLGDIRLRADFEVYLKKFMQSLDIVLPNPEADRYKIPVRRFAYILARTRQRYKDASLSLVDVGNKVRGLVNEHLISLGIDPKIPLTDLLSDDFVKDLTTNRTAKAKASEMEHAIRQHCKVHFEEDPALYARLSEKLEALIERYREQWEQLCLFLDELRKEVAAGRKDPLPGLTPLQAPFYDLIGGIAFGESGVPDGHSERTKKLVRDIFEKFRASIDIVNFWGNGFEIDRLKGDLTDLLLFTGIDELIDHREKIVTDITALARTRHNEIVA